MRDIFLDNMGQALHSRLWRELAETYPGARIDPDYFWSDQHFGHKNIIRYSDRPFKDLDDMREMMIYNYNAIVNTSDVVAFVGDFAFLPDDEANKVLARLNGHKILIIGNHDLHKKRGLKKLNFDEIYAWATMDDKFFITHYPMAHLPEPWFNIHGHEHVNGDEATVTGYHFNVNVEFHNFKPVSKDEILQRL
jgi:calcineurin-like phosphoesterase family protein